MVAEVAPVSEAVTVTLACTGGAELEPHPASVSASASKKPIHTAGLRRCGWRRGRKGRGSRTPANIIASVSCNPELRPAVASREAAMVRVTLVGVVPAFTDDGENEHCAPVGSPEQEKLTLVAFAVAA
ncbi:MAG TPA: hypothetical protein VEF05_11745, partial [Terriglobales bacterium]|nr:hypothetical protein [Terriglobales bacterium]